MQEGWIKQHRQWDESEAALLPPYMREMFWWLVRHANHEDNGEYKRGHCYCTYDEICEGLKWKVGYRTERYKKWQCEMMTKATTKAGMITTTRTTKKTDFHILNYDLYQERDLPRPQARDLPRNISTTATINKNEKNEKNNNPPISPLTGMEVQSEDELTMRRLWREVSGTNLINQVEKNLTAYRKMQREGMNMKNLLTAARAYRADKYGKRSIQAKVTNYFGVLEHAEFLESYALSLQDRPTLEDATRLQTSFKTK